jgi:ATP synthase protein I
MTQSDARQAKKILLSQLILTLILSAAGGFFSLTIALSVLVGAGASAFASTLFAYWVFRRYQAQEAELMVMRFYSAEILKILLVLGIFAAAFVLIEGLNIPVLLGAYFIAQVLPALMAS